MRGNPERRSEVIPEGGEEEEEEAYIFRIPLHLQEFLDGFGAPLVPT
jgi:hypothetical protein